MRYLLVAVFALLLCSPAKAAYDKHNFSGWESGGQDYTSWSFRTGGRTVRRSTVRHPRRAYKKAYYHHRLGTHRHTAVRRTKIHTHKKVTRNVRGVASTATYMPHPEGCPSRAFCGCGVSLFVFGERIRSLYLAANWLKFPRSEPGPGRVAARRGHVMAILKSYGDGTALVYDPNSGRHQTKIRRRSLAGFVVVNPYVKYATR